MIWRTELAIRHRLWQISSKNKNDSSSGRLEFFFLILNHRNTSSVALKSYVVSDFMVKHFFTKAKVSKLQNYRGQMVKKRLDLGCELWGETNMVKEKVVKEKVKLKLWAGRWD